MSCTYFHPLVAVVLIPTSLMFACSLVGEKWLAWSCCGPPVWMSSNVPRCRDPSVFTDRRGCEGRPWGTQCMLVPCTAFTLHYRVPPTPHPSSSSIWLWVVVWYVVTVKFKSVQVQSGETARPPCSAGHPPLWKCYCKLHLSTACKRFLKVLEP